MSDCTTERVMKFVKSNDTLCVIEEQTASHNSSAIKKEVNTAHFDNSVENPVHHDISIKKEVNSEHHDNSIEKDVNPVHHDISIKKEVNSEHHDNNIIEKDVNPVHHDISIKKEVNSEHHDNNIIEKDVNPVHHDISIKKEVNSEHHDNIIEKDVNPEHDNPIEEVNIVGNTVKEEPFFYGYNEPQQAHLDALSIYFGHTEFRPMQWQIINSIMYEKRDTCCIMATGYGKSLCYQFPPVFTGSISIVISPLISLMEDQVSSLAVSNISACLLSSAQDMKIQVIHDLLAGVYHLVYFTAEFVIAKCGYSLLLDLIKSQNVSVLAIDEAHCVSQWGHDFRQAYRNLVKIRDILPNYIPILAVTATATDTVRKDIIESLKLRDPQILCSSFDRPNLYFKGVKKSADTWADLSRVFESEKKIFNIENGSVIIYCITKEETDSVVELLKSRGIKCGGFHAGMSVNLRKSVQRQFVKDKIKIIVATIDFGIGIDKPNVRCVIHYGASSDMEGYYQEVGRAGRDGLPSLCILYHSRIDFITHSYRRIRQRSEIKSHKEAMNNIMRQYASTRDCRRHFILSYFEKNPPSSNIPKPNCCDNCSTRINASFGSTKTANNISIAAGPSESDVSSSTLTQATFFNSTMDYQELDENGETLLKELLYIRHSLAHSQNINPHTIVSDVALRQFALKLPTTIAKTKAGKFDGLSSIKIDKFGQHFVDGIKKAVLSNSNLVPTVSDLLERYPLTIQTKTRYGISFMGSLNLYNKGLTIEQISEKRKLMPSTIVDHLIEALYHGCSLDITKLPLYPDRVDHVITAIKTLNGDTSRLALIKSACPGFFTYEEIKLCLCYYNIRNHLSKLNIPYKDDYALCDGKFVSKIINMDDDEYAGSNDLDLSKFPVQSKNVLKIDNASPVTSYEMKNNHCSSSGISNLDSGIVADHDAPVCASASLKSILEDVELLSESENTKITNDTSSKTVKNDISSANITNDVSSTNITSGQHFIDGIKKAILSNSNLVPTVSDLLKRYPLTDIKITCGMSFMESLNLYNEGLTIQQIADKRKFVPWTIVDHLVAALYYGYNLDVTKLPLYPDRVDHVITAIKTLNGDTSRLALIKDACPGFFTYEEIKLCLCYYNIRNHLSKLNIPYKDDYALCDGKFVSKIVNMDADDHAGNNDLDLSKFAVQSKNVLKIANTSPVTSYEMKNNNCSSGTSNLDSGIVADHDASVCVSASLKSILEDVELPSQCENTTITNDISTAQITSDISSEKVTNDIGSAKITNNVSSTKNTSDINSANVISENCDSVLVNKLAEGNGKQDSDIKDELDVSVAPLRNGNDDIKQENDNILLQNINQLDHIVDKHNSMITDGEIKTNNDFDDSVILVEPSTSKDNIISCNDSDSQKSITSNGTSALSMTTSSPRISGSPSSKLTSSAKKRAYINDTESDGEQNTRPTKRILPTWLLDASKNKKEKKKTRNINDSDSQKSITSNGTSALSMTTSSPRISGSPSSKLTSSAKKRAYINDTESDGEQNTRPTKRILPTWLLDASDDSVILVEPSTSKDDIITINDSDSQKSITSNGTSALSMTTSSPRISGSPSSKLTSSAKKRAYINDTESDGEQNTRPTKRILPTWLLDASKNKKEKKKTRNINKLIF